ncbi:MAG: hypothetical protein ACYC6Y_14900 [Thermoguttaceae bacterium]
MDSSNEPLGNDAPYATVNARLRAMVEALPVAPPWFEAWARLDSNSSVEERLVVCQAIRRSGILSDEASFWLVSYVIDDMASRDSDEVLGEYEAQLQAIEERYGFDDIAIWPSNAAPPEYTLLRQEYYQAWDDLYAREFEKFGEQQMASLFRQDRPQFIERAEKGRQFFYGPKSADECNSVVWLDRLVNAVADATLADGPMGPLGCRYREEDDFWEVDVYPTPLELVGGATDGEVVAPPFTFDVEQLRTAFDRIEALVWQSQGFPNDEGPRLIIEGAYRGRGVYLQVLAYAPEDEEPAIKLNTTRRSP